MSDIFISYAREDRDKAKALAELFQQQTGRFGGTGIFLLVALSMK